MKEIKNKKDQFSRRNILRVLGGGLLIPLFGFGNTIPEVLPDLKEENKEEYKIFLRKDGTTVKVKTSSLEQLEKVKKNISNKSFYSWLKNKL